MYILAVITDVRIFDHCCLGTSDNVEQWNRKDCISFQLVFGVISFNGSSQLIDCWWFCAKRYA